MGKLIFLFFLLISCQKDKHNFSCDCVYTYVSLDNTCQYTKTFLQYPHDNMTSGEIIDWMNSQKIEVIRTEYGQEWKVTGKCHCIPYYCP